MIIFKMLQSKGILTLVLSAAMGMIMAAAFSSGHAAGNSKKVSTRGLDITVTDMKKKAGDYWKFNITVRNSTDINKQFEGTIRLLQQSPAAVANPEPMEVATCTVFKKIPAGKTISDISYCKGGYYSFFDFKVVRVYNKGKAGKSTEKKYDPGKDDKSDTTDLDKMDKELNDMKKELDDMEKELK